MGAVFGRENETVELLRVGQTADLIKLSHPSVAFGGDVAGIALRDDALPARGALLQARILTGTLRNLLLLDGSVCTFQCRVAGRRGWQTLMAAGRCIPAREEIRLRAAKFIRLRALGPTGASWAAWKFPLAVPSRKRIILRIDVDARQQALLHVTGGQEPLEIPLFAAPNPSDDIRDRLSPEEVDVLLNSIFAETLAVPRIVAP